LSPVEQKLWLALQQTAEGMKLKFRRQQPIRPYIADFACMKAKLLIELDGTSHDTQVKYDQARDAYLRAQGYKVLRFSNQDVANDVNGVVETIVRDVKALLK